METVRVIGARSLGVDFDFPLEEMTVDEESEFLVDTSRQRIRSESRYFFMAGKTLQKRHAVTLYTPKSIVSYTLSMDGTSAPMSMPTIYETPDHSRERRLDGIFHFEPPIWALGYLNAADIDRPEFDGRSLDFRQHGAHTLIISPKKVPFLRYDVDATKDFALTRCALYSPDSTTFDVGQSDLSIDVTWQQLPEGWYPQSWQRDLSNETKRTRVAKWEFLQHVADDLWDELNGVREPGRLVYTKDGARRLDNDLAIIPAGSYEKPGSWFNSVVVLALVGLAASVLWWRRKTRSA